MQPGAQLGYRHREMVLDLPRSERKTASTKYAYPDHTDWHSYVPLASRSWQMSVHCRPFTVRPSCNIDQPLVARNNCIQSERIWLILNELAAASKAPRLIALQLERADRLQHPHVATSCLNFCVRPLTPLAADVTLHQFQLQVEVQSSLQPREIGRGCMTFTSCL